MEKKGVCQRAMESAMMGVTLKDKISNKIIRERTKVKDITKQIAKLKWQWVGHVARQNPNRWTLKITQWRPCMSKRSIERPIKRWRDDIKEISENQWMKKARDRKTWKSLEEAYIQHWMSNG